MDGVQLYKHIAEEVPSLATRVIFITGDVLNPETREFIETTGNPFVMKPFSLQKIREMSQRLIERIEAEESST